MSSRSTKYIIKGTTDRESMEITKFKNHKHTPHRLGLLHDCGGMWG